MCRNAAARALLGRALSVTLQRLRNFLTAVTAPAALTATTALIALTAPCTVHAQASGPAAAEQLVRQTYFEGLPLARVQALDDAAGVRLAEMLGDPDEAEHHANIVVALGLCGCGPAFETLRDFAARPRSADVPRPDFLAWEQVPYAMGHLARVDARALAWLANEAAHAEPGFSYAARSASALARQRRAAAVQGLGLAGTAASDAELVRLAAAHPQDAFLARRVARAREICARVGTHGIESLEHRGQQ